MTTVADLPYYHLVPKGLRDNLRFRRFLLDCGYRDDELAREIWCMCSRDPLFYINCFGWVYSPTEDSQCPDRPFITYPFQDELVLELVNAISTGTRQKRQHRLINKSRDMGVSWVCLAVYEWFWKFRRGQSFLLGSRNEEYVDDTDNPKSLFYKIDFLHDHQPVWLLPTGRHLGRKDDPNRTVRHLRNADTGSVIDGEATTGDFARGDRRTSIFTDEFGAHDVGAEIESSISSATGCWIVNSTPQPGSYYCKLRDSGRMPVLTFHWSRHPEKNRGLYGWDEGTRRPILHDPEFEYPADYEFLPPNPECKFPVRSPWYDEVCRTEPESQVAQEHDIVDARVGARWFSEDVMRIAERGIQRPFVRGELIPRNGFWDDPEFVEVPGGRLEIFIPLVGGRPPADRSYVNGNDIAAGLNGDMSSNSCSYILDDDTGEQVAQFVAKDMLPYEFCEYSIAMSYFFSGREGGALLNWENDGPTGGAFRKAVIANGYGRLYRRAVDSRGYERRTSNPGFSVSGEQKAVAFSQLTKAIKIGNHAIRSEETVRELRQFVNHNGKPMHVGTIEADSVAGDKYNHGDRVVAAVMAEVARKTKAVERSPTAPKSGVPVQSFLDRQRNARNSRRNSKFSWLN